MRMIVFFHRPLFVLCEAIRHSRKFCFSFERNTYTDFFQKYGQACTHSTDSKILRRIRARVELGYYA